MQKLRRRALAKGNRDGAGLCPRPRRGIALYLREGLGDAALVARAGACPLECLREAVSDGGNGASTFGSMGRISQKRAVFRLKVCLPPGMSAWRLLVSSQPRKGHVMISALAMTWVWRWRPRAHTT